MRAKRPRNVRAQPSAGGARIYFARRRPAEHGAEGAARTGALLDRHAFREVARLVDVGAVVHGDVVREQLQRDREQDGQQHGLLLGTCRTSHAMSSSSGDGLSVTAMMRPPRDSTSFMFERLLP